MVFKFFISSKQKIVPKNKIQHLITTVFVNYQFEQFIFEKCCSCITKTISMKTKEYSNGEITIVWEAARCIHSGICVKTLPNVYNPKERPWIKVGNATTSEIKEQVAMCPSGALSIK